MKQDLIISEFCKSTIKAFGFMSKKHNCLASEVQIGLGLNTNTGENYYRVFRNFALLESVPLKDILFISPIYSFFKSQVGPIINKSLVKIKDSESVSGNIIVFLMQSENAGMVRMLLYVNGEYVRDLSAQEIINLN